MYLNPVNLVVVLSFCLLNPMHALAICAILNFMESKINYRFFTIMFAFFGLPSPSAAKGLIDVASFIGVMGAVLGGCLIAYGSEWGAAFKLRPNREEAEIAVGVYKLAVRILLDQVLSALCLV